MPMQRISGSDRAQAAGPGGAPMLKVLAGLAQGQPEKHRILRPWLHVTHCAHWHLPLFDTCFARSMWQLCALRSTTGRSRRYRLEPRISSGWCMTARHCGAQSSPPPMGAPHRGIRATASAWVQLTIHAAALDLANSCAEACGCLCHESKCCWRNHRLLLASLCLCYGLDAWIRRSFSYAPVKIYAADAICRCQSPEAEQPDLLLQARVLSRR